MKRRPNVTLLAFLITIGALAVPCASWFAVGYHDAMPDPDAARRAVSEIRLLDARELRELFPGARIYRERVAALTKSLIAYGGWTT